ncbi:Deoxynucleoside kinase like protein [Aduncisulcus paluster]|uniref:Deoxynucleoside kinase like protein n=1 Tax=Aduncisulcus paluster TaxID=2918883 RepID=A0ABQ5KYU2_9EUKA|nr:Deoxynucleoside kinase like protein [Aduncisulcus paluster]
MIIIIEGNISAGKSTLAKKLASTLGLRLFQEPVVENPYLAKFYEDPCKWALKMQMWLLKQRYDTYQEGIKHFKATGQGIIFDRSIYSDDVFARNSTKCGQISPDGYKKYWAKRAEYLEHCEIPHYTIYLDVSPEICHYRIRHVRCRACESSIPLEYLKALHSEYLTFLHDMKQKGSIVLRIDWERFGSVDSIVALVCPPVKDEEEEEEEEEDVHSYSKLQHVTVEYEVEL